MRQGNRVGLRIYGRPTINLLPGYGKTQLHQILRVLAQTAISSNTGLDSLQYLPVHIFSSHSLVLILSPLTLNDWRLFPRLRAYGYQVLLISPDPFDYLRDVHPPDSTTRLANRLVHAERQLEIQKIRQLWIPVINWQVGQPLSPLVRYALSQSRVQRQR